MTDRINKVGGHKTAVLVEDGQLTVIYHNTAVVKANPGKIILNSGGHKTQTTKLRMNQASNEYNLGFEVFQRDYEWFVTYKGQTHEFRDGITFMR